MKTPAPLIFLGVLYLTSCLFMLWEAWQKKNIKKNIIRCLLFLASYGLIVVNHIENNRSNQLYEGYFAATDSATRVTAVKITDLHTGGDTMMSDPTQVRALKKAFIENFVPTRYSITKDLLQCDWISDKDLNEEIYTLKFYTEPDGELLLTARVYTLRLRVEPQPDNDLQGRDRFVILYDSGRKKQFGQGDVVPILEHEGIYYTMRIDEIPYGQWQPDLTVLSKSLESAEPGTVTDQVP